MSVLSCMSFGSLLVLKPDDKLDPCSTHSNHKQDEMDQTHSNDTSVKETQQLLHARYTVLFKSIGMARLYSENIWV